MSLRAKVSDSCLIEEKLDTVTNELWSQLQLTSILVSKMLGQIASRTSVSNTLMNLIGLKRKEQALTLVNKLGAQTVKTQSEDVWMKIRVMTE